MNISFSLSQEQSHFIESMSLSAGRPSALATTQEQEWKLTAVSGTQIQDDSDFQREAERLRTMTWSYLRDGSSQLVGCQLAHSEDARDILRVSSMGGVPLRIHMGDGAKGPDVAYAAEDDTQAWLGHWSEGTWCVVQADDEFGLLLLVHEQCFWSVPLFPSVCAAEVVSFDVSALRQKLFALQEQTTDQQLVRLLAARSLHPNLWSSTTVMGSWMRLHDSDAATRTQTVEALLSGELPTAPELVLPKEWVRSLSASERAHIDGLLSSRVGLLLEEGKELQSTCAFSMQWRNACLQWLVERDELESVRALLHVCDMDDVAVEELEWYDGVAQELVGQFAVETEAYANPLLRRARTLDPDAWWCQDKQLSLEQLPPLVPMLALPFDVEDAVPVSSEEVRVAAFAGGQSYQRQSFAAHVEALDGSWQTKVSFSMDAQADDPVTVLGFQGDDVLSNATLELLDLELIFDEYGVSSGCQVSRFLEAWGQTLRRVVALRQGDVVSFGQLTRVVCGSDTLYTLSKQGE